MARLDPLTAINLASRLKVLPNFQNDDDVLSVIADWLVEKCQSASGAEIAYQGHRAHDWSPEDQAREIISRATKVDRWGGIAMLERIHEGLVSHLKGEWRPPRYWNDAQGTKCDFCDDMGYHFDSSVSRYVRCACGCMPETAETFMRLDNERLKQANKRAIETLRSKARTAETLKDIEKIQS